MYLFTCAGTYTMTKMHQHTGTEAEWTAHEHETEPRADVSRPHDRAFARYLGMYTQSLAFLPLLLHPAYAPPHSLPVSRSDRLKWFVFDLTTTATAAVDGGTIFPPRTLPSFNVSRGCVEELHARPVFVIVKPCRVCRRSWCAGRWGRGASRIAVYSNRAGV